MGRFDWSAFAAALPWTAGAVVLLLGITFLIAVAVGKHAVVDVAWGLGFAVIAVTAWVVSAGDGAADRRLLITGLTVIWGVRLAAHIGWRSRGHGEDPRYAALMEKAGDHPRIFALQRIYLTQAVMMWFISLPVQIAAFGTTVLNALAWVGAGVWLVGFTFETVGDRQLHVFRTDPANRGQVLDTGLWRYTRHPNYFGDACVWWGLSLIAFSAWPGIITIASPVVMTLLLAKGTGKPLLEKDIADRRPGYADYVRRTSGFIPLPPKSPTEGQSTR